MLTNMPKVIRLSLALRVICWIGLVALPGFEFAIWLNPDWLKESQLLTEIGVGDMELTLLQRIGALSIALIPVSVLTYGLWRLALLFSAYARGVILDPVCADHLKAFSICILLNGVLSIASTTALTAYLSFMGRPEGQRVVSITVGDQDIGVFLMGGLLLVVAWIMGVGAKVADEHRQFV